MKVFTAKMMSQLEAEAYRKGHTEQGFMEKAGLGVALAIQDFIQNLPTPIERLILLCGKDNNAGDAFVAGCYLLEKGLSVSAVQLEELSHCSPLCQQNGKRFLSKGGHISNQFNVEKNSLLIDALFGTGFKGQIKEPYASLIEKANHSGCPILAVDIPSGLDGSTGKAEGAVIQATETLFLGHPKLGFFLRDGWNAVGKLRFIDFGLPDAMSQQEQAAMLLLTQPFIQRLLPPLKRNRHKYQAGYVMGLAGSPAMPGAALLASLAALRAGSGMVRLLYPEGMEAALACSPYELIKVPYQADAPQTALEWMQKGGASFVGPGLGRTAAVKELLHACLPLLDKPCVIDADALFFFADQAYKLPPQAILTPHTGEMQTLLQQSARLVLDESLLQVCQQYADKHEVTLILKGAPTFIFHPHAAILVNPTGNPGMATAGSGDVLTGILASLLSQGLGCQEAAAMGAYLHGLSGDLAAQARGTARGLVAGDLIAYLAEAYRVLESG